MSSSIDVSAESYFGEFGLQAKPVVAYEKLSEIERTEWPHGFGLEVRGTKAQIDTLLSSDSETGFPGAGYFTFLEHWGCMGLKGSWGEEFFEGKKDFKARNGMEAVRKYKPEQHAGAFRFHKDPSQILDPSFYRGDNASFLDALDGKGGATIDMLTRVSILIAHPLWTSGVNFWSPMRNRLQASTLIVPDGSFKRALRAHLSRDIQEVIAERSEFILGVLDQDRLYNMMIQLLQEHGIVGPEFSHLSISKEELIRRLYTDYYTNLMSHDKGNALTVRPRTIEGRLDRKITKDCPTRTVVDYSEPSVASWWEGLVMHKGSPTGIEASPVTTTGLSYDYKSGFYY